HPAKTEVRFADGRTVWTAVERAVRQAITGSGEAGEVPSVRVDGEATGRAEAAVQTFLSRPAASSGPVGDEAPYGGASASSPAWVAETAAPLIQGPMILGQHRLTYIVASDG